MFIKLKEIYILIHDMNLSRKKSIIERANDKHLEI
jgi:hypothetical protein